MVSTRSAGAAQTTPIPDIAAKHAVCVSAARDGVLLSYDARYRAIQQMLRLVADNRRRLVDALKGDLGHTCEFWPDAVELETVTVEGQHALDSLKGWMKTQAVETPPLLKPCYSEMRHDPLGAVLVIGAFNYPISLSLAPCIAALSAGNSVVLKPSELSVRTCALMAELVPQYFEPTVLQVVTGAIPETTALLDLRWDLIFYTGSSRVGKIVAAAGAKNLSRVVLELGGKCPAIVCDDANLSQTAERLLFGKFTMNMGQTCLSPDYVLVSKKTLPKLREMLVSKLEQMFTADPKSSADISRMVNEMHTQRVANLLDDPSLEVVVGGGVDLTACYIDPTIVVAQHNSKVMQDEIFGPVLPLVALDDADFVREAAAFVRDAHEKPLALYLFTFQQQAREYVLNRTSSGGVCINDVVMHAANPHLPFGGVGHSGNGSYHGRFGFDACSHQKAVLVRRGPDPFIRFAPHTEFKLKAFRYARMIKSHHVDYFVGAVAVGIAAAAVSYVSPSTLPNVWAALTVNNLHALVDKVASSVTGAN